MSSFIKFNNDFPLGMEIIDLSKGKLKCSIHDMNPLINSIKRFRLRPKPNFPFRNYYTNTSPSAKCKFPNHFNKSLKIQHLPPHLPASQPPLLILRLPPTLPLLLRPTNPTILIQPPTKLPNRHIHTPIRPDQMPLHTIPHPHPPAALALQIILAGRPRIQTERYAIESRAVRRCVG